MQRAAKTTMRRHRARPVPKWVLKDQELEELSRRRLLMVLSVQSGEKPVTDVIAETSISRGTYYQLEEKALRAMLVALSPTSGPEGTEASALQNAQSRIHELEERVKQLER